MVRTSNWVTAGGLQVRKKPPLEVPPGWRPPPEVLEVPQARARGLPLREGQTRERNAFYAGRCFETHLQLPTWRLQGVRRPPLEVPPGWRFWRPPTSSRNPGFSKQAVLVIICRMEKCFPSLNAPGPAQTLGRCASSEEHKNSSMPAKLSLGAFMAGPKTTGSWADEEDEGACMNESSSGGFLL